VARLEFGLSDFLFGSRSALCGSKHGIPRGLMRSMQAKWRVPRLLKKNTRPKK
jgi:hypothetical protein